MKGNHRATCPGCGNVRVPRTRGLCWACAREAGLVESFPANKYAPRKEPTEEELEVMIAEQMKCLPDWWEHERKEADRELRAEMMKRFRIRAKRGACRRKEGAA